MRALGTRVYTYTHRRNTLSTRLHHHPPSLYLYVSRSQNTTHYSRTSSGTLLTIAEHRGSSKVAHKENVRV